MAEDGKTSRPWQVIANELMNEHDPDHVIALAKELDRALEIDQQNKKKQAAAERLPAKAAS